MNTCINVKEKLNVGTKFLPFGDLRRGFFNEVVVPLQRHAFCFYNQFSLQFRSGGHETDLYFYHPDHIGSTSWVTDSAKNGIQYCEYLPYGEPFLDQRSTTWNSRYTFSGKERDGETGYSYFGARYYNSDLSIWLSVDPMSDKYPNQSNYVYCSNNPIRIIDPNGEDEYEFDMKGNYIRTIENKEVDRFHLVNRDGERLATSQDFEVGTVTGEIGYYNSLSKELGSATMFTVSDSKAADEIFQFLAQNTTVEWGSVNAESENGCKNFIGTNQDESSNNIRSIVKGLGFTIDRSGHNHPNDINSVSQGDHDGIKGNSSTQFYNWTQSHGYTYYNEYSPYVTKDGKYVVPLREVRVPIN